MNIHTLNTKESALEVSGTTFESIVLFLLLEEFYFRGSIALQIRDSKIRTTL